MGQPRHRLLRSGIVLVGVAFASGSVDPAEYPAARAAGDEGRRSAAADEGPLAPALAKLTKEAAAAVHPAGVPVIIGLRSAAGLDEAARGLEATGATVAWLEPAASPPQVGVLVSPGRLGELRELVRSLHGVVFADLQPGARLRNAESAWRCQSGLAGLTPVFDRGLRGEGQTIGIMDTGIDIDHCQFDDPVNGLPALNDDTGTTTSPLHRKVVAVDFYWEGDWPDPGPDDWDDQGHGSHVAGSAAGDQGADGEHQGLDGMAPAARLVIQDGGFAIDDCADLPGLGCPLRPLGPVLQQAYDQGARIHSDSWGDEENTAPFNRYTERTADVDRFVWQHRDMLVLFAGGNAGLLGDDTVGSPATGKNLLGVGAATHGDIEPPCPAAFSSRGWTQDGRIKPDLLVPGSGVWSADSDFDIETGNCSYDPKSGTSMASPTAAGLAALVRQYFVDGFYPSGAPDEEAGFAPSAALLRAMMIASAVDLTTLGCSGIEPIPSRDQGWGLVQLDRVLHFAGDLVRLLVDDHRQVFLSSADPAVSHAVRMRSPGPLKVVLAWTDPPSSSLAPVNLVNDLDLVVSGPDGSFLGNRMADGWSLPGGAPDRRNNVEVVWLPEATRGEWTVTVAPSQITEPDQEFALVVVGAAGSAVARRPGGARRAPDG